MMRGEASRVQVDGDCMRPVLEDGWLVQLVPEVARSGDVVALVARDGKLSVHRYLGQRPFWQSQARSWVRLAVTRPDQGNGFDPEVPLSDVLGVVRQVRRSAGEDFVPLRIRFSDRCAARAGFCRYVLRRVLRGPIRSAGQVLRPRSGKQA